MKQFAKRIQSLFTSYTNKVASNQQTFELLEYEYCLKYVFGDTEGDYISRELQAMTFNTKDRLFAWARTKSHFSGTVTFLDQNKENNDEYCQ